MSFICTSWRILGLGCGAGKSVWILSDGRSGVPTTMGASCPARYEERKDDNSGDEDRGRGGTVPLRRSVMFGWVSVNGSVCPVVTVTVSLVLFDRDTENGTEGILMCNEVGRGSMRDAVALIATLWSVDEMLNDCRVTRSENAGNGTPFPGRGKPGSSGTEGRE